MSDALLTEISGKLSKILAALEKGGAPAATSKPGTTTPPTGGTKAADPAAIAAAKAAADKKKKDDAEKAAAVAAAAKAAAAKGAAPAAGTKAPGGKRTIEEVREIIRKVAADVDKQSAKDILKDDGNGADKVGELKPEFYDKVYEACEVLLGSEGTPAATAPEEEDDFA